jgi:osmotically-inducible protein OsmY
MTIDKQLRLHVEAQLSSDQSVNSNDILVAVKDGVVTLGGRVPTVTDQVAFWHQSQAAESAVRGLWDVKGINAIEIRPTINPIDVGQEIHTAFQRHAKLPSIKAHVEVSDATMRLTGEAHCWQREDAENAARSTPGVSRVQNDICLRV